MNEKFPGQAYNFRQTLTGKQKFESYSDGSFDIVDGVLWFDKKRKMIGDHRPMNFAIGPVGEVDMDIRREFSSMVVVARGPGGTGVLKVSPSVAAALQVAFARFARTAQQPPATALAPAPPLSLVEQIRELARLRDDGLLTNDEFEAQKARVLKQT